jgi:FkbM family methyltransferase
VSQSDHTAPTSGRLPLAGRLVARHRRFLPLRKIAGACRRYLTWYENVNYDPFSNGEAFVLEVLSGFAPRRIFDVGANIGEWSLEASAVCAGAEIHAFEIAAPTFDVLVERTRTVPSIRCLNVGLSDTVGSIRIRHYDALPALTTATDYPHPFPYRELDATVTTGDGYARENGIDHVDLVKIDVEGMEERVLRGFETLFARGGIDVVQFEYGRASIMNRFLLRDFYTFLRTRGFLVGKVFPSYVAFKDYDFSDENFLGPNFLAVREGRSDYRRAFGGAS